MFNLLEKYLLLALLLTNLTAEYVLLMPVSKFLFYIVFALSLGLLLSRSLISFRSFKTYTPLYLLSLIIIIYELFTTPENSNTETTTYVIAKTFSFAIIICGIERNFDFYNWKFHIIFAVAATGLLLMGYFFRPVTFGGRLGFGFANPNAASSIAALSFAIYLFSNGMKRRFVILGASICFLAVILGGSRNALGICVLALLFRFGLSMKLILTSLIIFAGISLLPEIGIQVTAIDRLMGTLTGDVALDRENQHEAAMWMISQRPLMGWGFDAHMVGKAAELSEYGAHNGYLEMLTQMGTILGGCWIVILLFSALKISLRYKSCNDLHLQYHAFAILGILLAANQESYLIGVNQIITNLFFVSLAILLTTKSSSNTCS